jgi:1,4-dihydroxy-6-naphthoate synthase
MIKTQTIRIAHSPDSDDAFMFYAIKHKKIDLRGYEFEIASGEIDVLNQAAINSTLSATHHPVTQPLYDVFAVSFHAYHYLKDNYAMLRSGASMAGKDYGPRLVGKAVNGEWSTVNGMKIAVPGKYTSAFLALQIYLSEINSKNIKTVDRSPLTVHPKFIFCSYNDVFPLLESGQVDASLLIHESQLKFQEQGYNLIVDLGAWWYEKYTPSLRMPLGCNVIQRDLGEQVIADIDAMLKESIEWGLKNFDEVLAYSRDFAQNGLNDAQAEHYIHMYVDESTVQLTENDLKSVELMLSKVK